MTGNDDLDRIRAHERVWQSLYDRATEVLDAFGKKDYRSGADYWIVPDDWGPDLLKVEVKSARMLQRDAVAALKGLGRANACRSGPP